MSGDAGRRPFSGQFCHSVIISFLCDAPHPTHSRAVRGGGSLGGLDDQVTSVNQNVAENATFCTQFNGSLVIKWERTLMTGYGWFGWLHR